MKKNQPINVLNGLKFKEVVFSKNHLISINEFKNVENITSPFTKPISKIF